MKTKRIALMAMCIALAMILSYVESQIPSPGMFVIVAAAFAFLLAYQRQVISLPVRLPAEVIQQGTEMLGWDLDTLIDKTIQAMRASSAVD